MSDSTTVAMPIHTEHSSIAVLDIITYVIVAVAGSLSLLFVAALFCTIFLYYHKWQAS